MIVDEGLLCWNYRGAKNDEFHREMKEMIKVYRPLIIILLETRTSGDVGDGVCKQRGKSEWVRSKANGFSRGIWLFWNQAEIKIKVINSHKQFLHVLVTLGVGRN